MTYEFKVLQTFLTDIIMDESLVIIIGDHQPNAHITGPNTPPLVPIHILSRQKRLLTPFIEMGYFPGLIPQANGPYPGMDSFLGDFLVSYSQPAP
jgi:hypothetical protein